MKRCLGPPQAKRRRGQRALERVRRLLSTAGLPGFPAEVASPYWAKALCTNVVSCTDLETGSGCFGAPLGPGGEG